MGMLIGMADSGVHGKFCVKEYSVEGRPGGSLPPVPVDTIPPPDTVSGIPLLLAACTNCNSLPGSIDSAWSFAVRQTSVCGAITGVVISKDRDALTFFGPSGCSADSGLIITAYFATNPLDGDKAGVYANWASAIYYDNVGDVYLFESLPAQQFTLRINRYDYQTGIATGDFEGQAIFKNGDRANIHHGSFRIKIKPR